MHCLIGFLTQSMTVVVVQGRGGIGDSSPTQSTHVPAFQVKNLPNECVKLITLLSYQALILSHSIGALTVSSTEQRYGE